MMAVATELTTRQRIRSWWKDALNGKEDVRVADVARDAETELGLDASFREGFVETFLYAVLYDCGISMLSERRAALGEDGEWIGDPSRWLEYEPLSGRHIAFERMTPEQARAAAEFRQSRVNTELERIAALNQVAEGASVDSVLKTISAKTKADALMNEKVDPFWIESGLTTKETVGEALDELVAAASSEDDRSVNCRVCGALIGVRFGEVYTTDDDICSVCSKPAEKPVDACLSCGSPDIRVRDDEGWEYDDNYCPSCRKRYPESLFKAAGDYFDYALGLRTGEVVHFNTCKIRGDWVHLDVKDAQWYADEKIYKRLPFPFERGIDIRVDDIVWCCDAPYGS